MSRPYSVAKLLVNNQYSNGQGVESDLLSAAETDAIGAGQPRYPVENVAFVEPDVSDDDLSDEKLARESDASWQQSAGTLLANHDAILVSSDIPTEPASDGEIGVDVALASSSEEALEHGSPSSLADDAGGSGNIAAQSASLGTITQLADYLNNGYWGPSGPFHWAPGATVTVNITDLTPGEQALAVSALNAWHEVANINFSYTSGAAQITYNNDGPKAFCNFSVNGHSITSATISIVSNWGPNTNIYSYMYQTYLHETGHALGFGHQGPYNNTATYGVDNIFTNDTWQYSVMSYFSQGNFGGASSLNVITPQMADIEAAQSFYGAASTRTGNTTYGFNNNAGSIYDFTQYSVTPSLTIHDSAGIDKLDFSGYSANQTINLNPGTWSSIGGYVKNIGIFTNTLIENAAGGAGNDTFYGNAVANVLQGMGGNDAFDGHLGNDIIFGGNGDDQIGANAGDDTVYGEAGNDALYGYPGTDTAVYQGTRSQYQITQLGGGAVQVKDLRSGSPEGTDTAYDIEFFKFSDGTFGNGVSSLPGAAFGVTGAASLAQGDFDSDGKRDLVWRDANALMSRSSLDGAGGAGGSTIGTVGFSWNVLTADHFVTNSTSQMLMRSDSDGTMTLWWLNNNSALVGINLGQRWGNIDYVDSGDFVVNQGQSDILVRNRLDNHMYAWWVSGGTLQGIDLGAYWANIEYKGRGDFTGDGVTDMLVRNLGDNHMYAWTVGGNGKLQGIDLGAYWNNIDYVAAGKFTDNGATNMLVRNAGDNHMYVWWIDANGKLQGWDLDDHWSNIQFLASGNFEGDSKAEMLVRNIADNHVYKWWVTAQGKLAGADLGAMDPNWQVLQTGDYNQDGYLDVIWRHADGRVAQGAQSLGSSSAGSAASGLLPDGAPASSASSESAVLAAGAAMNGTASDPSLFNVISGDDNNNVLSGADGKDLLDGSAGDDTLIGGQGEDKLFGSTGDDVLSGGSGADRVVYAYGDGRDQFVNFSLAEDDTVELRGAGAVGIGNFAQLQSVMSQDANGVWLNFSADNALHLHNVAIADLTAQTFSFG